jgi:Golgi nucleoside diphosphatase
MGLVSSFSICVLCLLVVFYPVFYAQELDYGIMIDAGSTGCRIYLYDWPHRENNSLPLVQPVINQTIISLKNNNPLSGFVNDPQNAGASLEPLIDYIKQHLAYDKWNVTPLYLKATAGMRALNLTSQAQIMASVQQYLATTPFQFSPDQAEVIPGTYEGIFGWITTNFVLDVLQRGDPEASYGTLDMGGASTQFTYVPQSPPKMDNYNLNLSETEYQLYTFSYPLGQNAALDLLLQSIVSANIIDTEGNVMNPCYLSGYNETYNGQTIVGTASYPDCVSLIEKFIVVKDPSCASCGIGDVYQPPIYGNYIAFSGFAYTYSFLGLSNTSTIADLQNATEEFCDTPWATVVAQHSTTPPAYLKFYCFTGAYYQDILVRGYGFSPTGNNLVVESIVGDIELSWALGAMIYEASLLPFGPDILSEF